MFDLIPVSQLTIMQLSNRLTFTIIALEGDVIYKLSNTKKEPNKPSLEMSMAMHPPSYDNQILSLSGIKPGSPG